MLDAKHIFSLKDTAITIVTAAKSSSNDIMVPLLPNNVIILLNVGNMYKTAVMLGIRQKDSRNDLDYNRYKLNKKDIIVEM